MGWEKKAEDFLVGALKGPADFGAAKLTQAFEATKRAARDLSGEVRFEGVSLRHGVPLPQGDGAALACSIASRLPLPAHGAGIAIWAYFGDESGVFQGAHPSFADGDGDLCAAAGAFLEPGWRRARAMLHVPYVAFPEAMSAAGAGDGAGVVVRLIAVSGDGTPIASHQERVAWPAPPAREEASVLRALARACLTMLTVDGRADETGGAAIARALEATFRPDALGRAAIAGAIDAARGAIEGDGGAPGGAEAVGRVLARLASTLGPDERVSCVELLFDVALQDGALLGGGEAFVRAVAAGLGVPDARVDEAKARRPALDLSPHWRALGLEPGASLADVKRAHLKAVRDYHPDKVDGLPQGFRDFATERLQTVNAARDALVRALERG
jgi:hypothetical protein